MADSSQQQDLTEGVGRGAASPLEIPFAGWKDIFWRVYKEITDDRVMLIAAGTTFYILLAMVPALTALISIYGLFADPVTVQDHLGSLEAFIPGGGMQILSDQLERLTGQDPTGLGFAFIISLGLALWSANAGMKSLFEALNVAYDEVEKRSFVKLTLTSLTFTIGAMVLVVSLIGIFLILPAVLSIVGLDPDTEWLITIGSGIILLIVAFAALAALFRWGPSRDHAEWRWITPGAVLVVILTGLVSFLFSFYVSNFGSYNETYGSLGAIIGFMTWIWLICIVLIIGGELNSEIEHQTAEDTTVGQDQPMGERGAVMADRLGETLADGEADESEGQHEEAGQARSGPARSDGDSGSDGHSGRDHEDGRRSVAGASGARSASYPSRERPFSTLTLALTIPIALFVAITSTGGPEKRPERSRRNDER